MEYFLTFIEGIASFVSPCFLPMIPIYIAYFAGKEEKKSKTLLNAIGFICGFTLVFILLSIFASTFGMFISKYLHFVKIIFGIVLIILGLNYMELIKIKFLNYSKEIKADTNHLNLAKSFVFGVLFAFSYTPCIGMFLGSALFLIAKKQQLLKGIILMLCYCLGFGGLLLAVVIFMERLKATLKWVKEHFKIVKIISGIILIIDGIYIMFF